MSDSLPGSRPAAASLNWREIDLVLSEILMPGSLIQEVHQPRHDRFVLHLFHAGASSMLLISLSARLPRMHLITEKLANPEKPYRFASFLRAHIRGGRIETAEQVRAPTAGSGPAGGAAEPPAAPAGAPAADIPGERIVRIVVLRGGERKVLWVRLWGAAANALLTDTSGVILDSFYRRPKKGEISGSPFNPLPAARARSAASAQQKDFFVRDLAGTGTFNERLEALFSEIETRGDVVKATAQADAELEISENKLLANLEKLTLRLSEYANVDRYRELGDLVTSNLHAIGKGERWLRVEDFFHSDALVEIELKPGLSPAQNAQGYYDRHRKARLGKSKVEEEIEHLKTTLARIRVQRTVLAETPDPDALGRVAEKAARARAPLREQSMPGLVFVSPPFRIIVGRTASENDELLRKRVRGNDWWFHARDWPGAYVFVKAQPGKSLPLETMLDAATLAMHFSRGKSAGQGDVYYTMVKYLRRAKGAKRGTVLPTQEKNLHVKIDPARIERLKTGESVPRGVEGA
jgi:predicted ribosome quality control (RQC) complex YloA/Tae2 family protein